MGDFVIGTSMTVFVWVISLGIIAINLFIVGGFVVDQGTEEGGWLYACVGVVGSLYLSFIIFLMWPDLVQFKQQACSFFVKLGGYDEVGRYDIFPSSPASIHEYGIGQLELDGDDDDDDDSSGLLGPQSARLTLSAPGEDYAPSSRVMGFDKGGDHDHRYNGVGERPSGGGDGSRSSPTASLTVASEQPRDEAIDSRA